MDYLGQQAGVGGASVDRQFRVATLSGDALLALAQRLWDAQDTRGSATTVTMTDDEIVQRFGHLFNNTGNNDPKELLARLNSSERLAFTNIPVLVMASCQQAQVTLIRSLMESGMLKEKGL